MVAFLRDFPVYLVGLKWLENSQQVALIPRLWSSVAVPRDVGIGRWQEEPPNQTNGDPLINKPSRYSSGGPGPTGRTVFVLEWVADQGLTSKPVDFWF